MPKLFLINGGKQNSKLEELILTDMDWSGMVDQIQDKKINRIRSLIKLWCKDICSEINATDNPDRIRFLEKVKCSIDGYLNQNKNIDNELYYILIYYLDHNEEYYTTLSEDDTITLHCDNSVQSRTIVFMLNQFNKNLVNGNTVSMEMFLSSIL